MKIKFLKKRKAFAPVAMSDIAFLLLIFLVVTANMDENGDITVPKFGFSKKTGFSDTLNISITETEQFAIDGKIVAKHEIPGILQKAGEAKVNVVQILAHKDLKYRVIDTLMSELQTAGLFNIVLLTEERKDE